MENLSAAHKRNYQACIPCRQRKVRCDLGSVDDPHDPPCVRCRREKKECFFTETRRKRKAEDEAGEEYGQNQGLRKQRNDLNEPLSHAGGTTATQEDDSFPTTRNLGEDDVGSDREGLDRTPMKLSSLNNKIPGPKSRRKSPPARIKKTPDGREVTNETAAALFHSPINNPADALHLLVDAVARSGDLDSQGDVEHPGFNHQGFRHSGKGQTLPTGLRAQIRSPAIDPAIAGDPSYVRITNGVGFKDALQAWSRLRFVRAGWFTAIEAMSYIDYFYEHLAALTPIAPPEFNSLAAQPRLLSEEPMLTVTLLTIASRYKELHTPGGQSKSLMIHEKLWTYLQGMITRMFWGQEQFAGGFGSGGNVKGSGSGGSKQSLRSIGSVESLLLLSDWHPRSMHFNPGDDDHEIIAPLITDVNENENSNLGLPRTTYAGWTEPALRSDRMCWSLIGCAYTLSYELGIFDSLVDHGTWIPHSQHKRSYDTDRADRLGRLLHIYVSQTCGRLGFPNIWPENRKGVSIDFFKMKVLSSGSSGPSNAGEVSDNFQRSWAELTGLMRQGNAGLFESKAMSREKIQKGEYKDFLDDHGPRLHEWLNRFASIEVPPVSRTLLMIEYEYARTYVYSLSLQAVLEQIAATKDGSSSLRTGHTPPALVSSALIDFNKENAAYIAEVVDASRNVLRHVVEGLVPNGGLKHSPVRTHLRILSAAMFLLKTFALGAKEKEVAISMQLLDDTVKALRTEVVDDVHLCLRVAELLSGLTSSIRHKFVRLAAPGVQHDKQQGASDHDKNAKQPSSTFPIQSPNHRSGGARKITAFGRRPGISDSKNPTKNIYHLTQGPLAGISPNLVDPNDSSITIIPPPEYNYGTNAFGAPPSSNSPPNHLHTHPAPRSAQSHFPHHSLDLSSSLPQSQQSHMQPQPQSSHQSQGSLSYSSSFHPNTNSIDLGDDWLTLDVNPLINPQLTGHGAGSDGNGNSSSGLGGNWAGAFGPEIGESIEMLGVLTDGYGWQDGMGWVVSGG